MLTAYCGLLDEQQVCENVYKFESILHLMVAKDE